MSEPDFIAGSGEPAAVWLPRDGGDGVGMPDQRGQGTSRNCGKCHAAFRCNRFPQDSVAVPLGLELIDRALLTDLSGRLPAILVAEVDAGLRIVLGL